MGLPNFPIWMGKGVGGLIGETPLVCGGYIRQKTEDVYDMIEGEVVTDSCYVLKDRKWTKSSTSLHSKGASFGTGSVVADGKLLISGGIDHSMGFYNDVHLNQKYWINEDTKSSPQSMPDSVFGHCNVLINDTHYLQTGGLHNEEYVGDVLKYTFFHNIKTGQWSEGKNMRMARYEHGCSQVTIGGKQIIIIAGGRTLRDSSYATDTVEYLKMDDLEEGWIKGEKRLPFQRYGLRMVTSFDMMKTYIIGWPHILVLVCDQPTPEKCYFESNPEGGQLMKERSYHIAFAIPDSLANKLCD